MSTLLKLEGSEPYSVRISSSYEYQAIEDEEFKVLDPTSNEALLILAYAHQEYWDFGCDYESCKLTLEHKIKTMMGEAFIESEENLSKLNELAFEICNFVRGEITDIDIRDKAGRYELEVYDDDIYWIFGVS